LSIDLRAVPKYPTLDEFIVNSILRGIFETLYEAQKEEFWKPCPIPDAVKAFDFNLHKAYWARHIAATNLSKVFST
jgi:hypothetical protein